MKEACSSSHNSLHTYVNIRDNGYLLFTVFQHLARLLCFLFYQHTCSKYRRKKNLQWKLYLQLCIGYGYLWLGFKSAVICCSLSPDLFVSLPKYLQFHDNFHVGSSVNDRKSVHSALAHALESREGTPEEVVWNIFIVKKESKFTTDIISLLVLLLHGIEREPCGYVFQL